MHTNPPTTEQVQAELLYCKNQLAHVQGLMQEHQPGLDTQKQIEKALREQQKAIYKELEHVQAQLDDQDDLIEMFAACNHATVQYFYNLHVRVDHPYSSTELMKICNRAQGRYPEYVSGPKLAWYKMRADKAMITKLQEAVLPLHELLQKRKDLWDQRSKCNDQQDLARNENAHTLTLLKPYLEQINYWKDRIEKLESNRIVSEANPPHRHLIGKV